MVAEYSEFRHGDDLGSKGEKHSWMSKLVGISKEPDTYQLPWGFECNQISITIGA